MNMKKCVKLMAPVLVLALLAGSVLVACKPGTTPEQGNVNASDKETDENASDVTEEGSKDETKDANGAERLSLYEVNLERENFYDYDGMMYSQGGYDKILLGEGATPELLSSIEQWNLSQTKAMTDEFENIKSCARTDYEDNPEYFFGPYESFSDLYIKRADSKVLSVEEDIYFFSGGIHGTGAFSGYTWDAQTGKQLQLEDVITDMNSLPALLAEKFEQKYPDVGIFQDSTEEMFKYYLEPDRAYDFTWTLEHDGIVFYFGHYELTAYADGVQQLKILFAEKPDLFAEAYMTDDSQTVVTHFEPGCGIDVDVDGDCVTENVSVICMGASADEPCFSYSVYFDGLCFEQESYFYTANTYLVKNNGKNYVYVEKYHDNDARSFDVYSIQKGSLEQVGTFDGALKNFLNPDCFTIQRRADLLGTHSIAIKCAIGEEGMPVYLEEDYSVLGGSVVSKKEFEATALDAEGNQDGPVTYPVGTEFFFDRTDGESYMILKLADGTKCYVTVTQGWPPTVNGYDAQECFEELLYAG